MENDYKTYAAMTIHISNSLRTTDVEKRLPFTGDISKVKTMFSI